MSRPLTTAMPSPSLTGLPVRRMVSVLALIWSSFSLASERANSQSNVSLRDVPESAWQQRDDQAPSASKPRTPQVQYHRGARLRWKSDESPTRSATLPRSKDDPFHDPFGDGSSLAEHRDFGRPVETRSVFDEPATTTQSAPAASLSKPAKSPSRQVQLASATSSSDPFDGPSPEPTPAHRASDWSAPQVDPFFHSPVSTMAAPPRKLQIGGAEVRPTATSKPNDPPSIPLFRASVPQVRPESFTNQEGLSSDIVPPITSSNWQDQLAAQRRRVSTVSSFLIHDPSMPPVQSAQYNEEENWDTLPSVLPPQPDQRPEDLDELFRNNPEAERSRETPEELDFNSPFRDAESEPASTLPTPSTESPRSVPQDEEPDWKSILEADGEEKQDESARKRCDRIYNDRNCCEDEEECRKYVVHLRDRRLREISTDITPPFDPLAKDDQEARQRQRQRMLRAPARAWHNEFGQKIADGRFVDYRDGDIIVEQSSGERRRIKWLALGRDERCFVSAWWNLPIDCIPNDPPAEIRDWTMTTFTWTASALCHRPLYIEDVSLERYGHSANPVLQPLLSGAHFYGSIALLPYSMGLYPPTECMYSLGYYRPGSCAPWLVHAFPISRRAILAETTAIFALWGFLY